MLNRGFNDFICDPFEIFVITETVYSKRFYGSLLCTSAVRCKTATIPRGQRRRPTHHPLRLSVWGRQRPGSLHSELEAGKGRKGQRILAPS